MGSRSYPRIPCYYCGQRVSSSGRAFHGHMRSHIARGDVEAIKEVGAAYGYRALRPAPDWRHEYPHGWWRNEDGTRTAYGA